MMKLPTVNRNNGDHAMINHLRRKLHLLIAIPVIWLFFAFCAYAGDAQTDLEEISMIFYGDSRTIGLAYSAGGCTYIGKVSAGYSWMAGEGYSYLKEAMAAHPDAGIVFCFGVNDLGNVDSYIQFFRDFIAAFPDRKAYFASVNPIADSYAAANGYTVRNVSVEAFNARVEEELPDYYLDTYTFLAAGGYDTLDGVHYGSETYIKIQNLTKILAESKEMEAAFEETTEQAWYR